MDEPTVTELVQSRMDCIEVTSVPAPMPVLPSSSSLVCSLRLRVQERST